MLSKKPKNLIGKNIRRLRQKKGISQDRLSKFADLSLNTIANIESGGNLNPTIDTNFCASKNSPKGYHWFQHCK